MGEKEDKLMRYQSFQLAENLKIMVIRTSLVIQWLRFRTPNAEGPGLIPVQGTRSHMPQLRGSHATAKNPMFGTEDGAQPNK